MFFLLVPGALLLVLGTSLPGSEIPVHGELRWYKAKGTLDGLGLEERCGRELPAGWDEEPTAQNMVLDLRGLRHFRSRCRCKRDTVVLGGE